MGAASTPLWPGRMRGCSRPALASKGAEAPEPELAAPRTAAQRGTRWEPALEPKRLLPLPLRRRCITRAGGSSGSACRHQPIPMWQSHIARAGGSSGSANGHRPIPLLRRRRARAWGSCGSASACQPAPLLLRHRASMARIESQRRSAFARQPVPLCRCTARAGANSGSASARRPTPLLRQGVACAEGSRRSASRLLPIPLHAPPGAAARRPPPSAATPD